MARTRSATTTTGITTAMAIVPPDDNPLCAPPLWPLAVVRGSGLEDVDVEEDEVDAVDNPSVGVIVGVAVEVMTVTTGGAEVPPEGVTVVISVVKKTLVSLVGTGVVVATKADVVTGTGDEVEGVKMEEGVVVRKVVVVEVDDECNDVTTVVFDISN